MTTHIEKKKMLAPQLRFKGFNEDWIDTRLKDITNLITKGTTPQSFSNEGINYVKIEGLVGVNINKEKCLYIDEKTHNKELRRSILQNNDLLFAIAGATIGKIAIVTEDILPANTNQALAIIRLKNIKNLKYMLQILQSRIMKKYIQESISVGAQPNLNLEQMGDFRFHLPTLPEQQKIASFLSAVDEKIQQLSRKKELLEQYKKGVMQRLFLSESGFLGLEDEQDDKEKEILSFLKSGKSRFRQLRFKDEDGKAFPKWEEKRLGDVLDYIQPTKYLVASIEYDDSYSTPVLTAGKTFILGYTNETNDIYNKNLPVILFDDFTTATQFVDFPFKAKSSAMKILVAKEGENISYIFEAMKLIKFEIGGHGRHWISQFALFNIPFPCIEEQKKIANYLSSIDNKIEIVTKQITQTQTFKKGLLQQMFV